MRTLLVDLPPKVKGAIIRIVDTDEKVVLLNSKLSWEQNRKTYLHELSHEDDFCKGYEMCELEKIRHGGS